MYYTKKAPAPSINEQSLIRQGENLLYDARLLHKDLRSKRQFADWAKDKIVNSLFREGVDYFSQKSEKLGVGRKGMDYHLTLDTAKHIAMMENNEIGYAVRCAFIQKEKESRIGILPREAEAFKGLRRKTINGRSMYPYKLFLREKAGYGQRSSGYHYKAGYPGHFVTMDGLSYISEELALQIYHSRRLQVAREANKAMQPVLPFNFGEPLQIKGGIA